MSKSRNIIKITVPVADLRAMSADHRYAILLLGLLSNEAGWLRKLLVKAVLGITEDPEPDGWANFALTALLTTTLAGKIHEGWHRVGKGRLGNVLNQIGMPAELQDLRKKINREIAVKIFKDIRNGLAFHYPNETFDFKKLGDHLDDSDTVIYMALEGYQGDVFSQLSNLAGIEPIIALDPSNDYSIALKKVSDHVMSVAGLYCLYISEAMGIVLQNSVPHLAIEDIVIHDAPEADEYPLRFFVHPPSELEETHKLMNAQGDNVLRARPVKGEIDYAALSQEHIARYPKIRARLAE